MDETYDMFVAVECETRGEVTRASGERVGKGEEDVCAGRLAACVEFYKKIGAGNFVLGIIQNGYLLPFRQLPHRMRLTNHRSAEEYKKNCLGVH